MTEQEKLINVDLYGDGSRNSRLRAEYIYCDHADVCSVYKEGKCFRKTTLFGVRCEFGRIACAYQIYGDNDDEPIGRCKSCPLCQSDKIRHKQESVYNDPLVLDELRQMRGEPVWCKELECYGIVKMEKVGSWANELFLVGTWHNGDAAVNFEYDIKSRGLTLYRHKPEEGTV